jgi:hypothetical protein
MHLPQQTPPSGPTNSSGRPFQVSLRLAQRPGAGAGAQRLTPSRRPRCCRGGPGMPGICGSRRPAFAPSQRPPGRQTALATGEHLEAAGLATLSQCLGTSTASGGVLPIGRWTGIGIKRRLGHRGWRGEKQACRRAAELYCSVLPMPLASSLSAWDPGQVVHAHLLAWWTVGVRWLEHGSRHVLHSSALTRVGPTRVGPTRCWSDSSLMCLERPSAALLRIYERRDVAQRKAVPAQRLSAATAFGGVGYPAGPTPALK